MALRQVITKAKPLTKLLAARPAIATTTSKRDAHKLIPFFDEPAWAMDWDWDPFVTNRRRTPYRNSPLAEINRMARQLDQMRSEMDVDGGVVLKDNSFAVNLDVQGFRPKDLTVTLKDNVLTISGKHEEKTQDGNRYWSRQFVRTYRLPEGVQADQMKSLLAADGRTLKIEAPIAKQNEEKPAQETPIPIDRK